MDFRETLSVSDGQHEDERSGSFSVRSQEVLYRLKQSAPHIRKLITETIAKNFIGPTEGFPEIPMEKHPYWPESINELLREIFESEKKSESLVESLSLRTTLVSTPNWINPEGTVMKSLKKSGANEEERMAILETFSMDQFDKITSDLMKEAIEKGMMYRTFRVAESSLDRLPGPWDLLRNFQLPKIYGRIQVVLASPQAACNIAREESQFEGEMTSKLIKEGFFQYEKSLKLRAIQLLATSYAAMYYLLMWDPALYSFQIADALPTFRGGTVYDKKTDRYEILALDQIRKQGIGRGGIFRIVEYPEDIETVRSELKKYPHPTRSSDEIRPDDILNYYPELEKIERETSEAIRREIPDVPAFKDDICSHFRRIIYSKSDIGEMKEDAERLRNFLDNVISPLQSDIIVHIGKINKAYQKCQLEIGKNCSGEDLKQLGEYL